MTLLTNLVERAARRYFSLIISLLGSYRLDRVDLGHRLLRFFYNV